MGAAESATARGEVAVPSYRREELQIVPSMKNEWNPGVSKGRAFIDRLRAEGTITKWDARHNRPVRDGSTWAEKEIRAFEKKRARRELHAAGGGGGGCARAGIRPQRRRTGACATGYAYAQWPVRESAE
eukprot:COSAG03_NODE_148_length_11571_cov_9.471583_7_plen_129_part_00